MNVRFYLGEWQGKLKSAANPTRKTHQLSQTMTPRPSQLTHTFSVAFTGYLSRISCAQQKHKGVKNARGARGGGAQRGGGRDGERAKGGGEH